jgi:hypothetical protein
VAKIHDRFLPLPGSFNPKYDWRYYRMKKKNKWDMIWPWIEPITAVLIGLILYFPLNRTDLAEITWVLGFLLSFGSLATSMRLKEELGFARKMSEILDLYHESGLPAIREIILLYSSITEPEFSLLKDDAVDDVIARLARLAHDKISDELNSSEYHVWLLDALKQSKKGEKIHAISIVPEYVWLEIPAERRFLDENIEAAKRGIKIERVFISSKERLKEKRNRASIEKHIENSDRGLNAHIVWIEDLKLVDPNLVSEIGAGFILFGDRVVFIDISVPPAEAKGQVNLNPTRVKYYHRLFDRILLYSIHADSQFFAHIDNKLPPEAK